MRALAVVVVATPCPLILAAPIALVSGLSRAARAGVIVKGAGAIETLGQARTVLFDKTGTLTVGTPEVREIVPRDELSRRRAAAPRGLGRPDVRARARRGARARRHARRTCAQPCRTDVREDPGQGIQGTVDGRRVAVGSRAFLRAAGLPAGRDRGRDRR